MKRSRLLAGLLSGLLFATLAVPLGAAAKAETHPFYDLTQEVTLSGPVTGVVYGPSAGLIPGSHILLVTGSGTVDASLGKWGLQGKEDSIHNGEQVTVKGVMKTLKNKQVFFARTVEVGGHSYVLRNEHGVPVTPKSHIRVLKTAQRGVAQ
jgi:hypothetical protein